MPLHQQSGALGSLIKHHQYSIAKAKALSDGEDSIATKLYELLKYHFNEEEQYVFPPLGILPELAAGNIPEESEVIIGVSMPFK